MIEVIVMSSILHEHDQDRKGIYHVKYISMAVLLGCVVLKVSILRL